VGIKPETRNNSVKLITGTFLLCWCQFVCLWLHRCKNVKNVMLRHVVCDQEEGRVILRNVSEGVLELIITRLNAADASNYSCSAVNSVGHSQRTAVLTVNCKQLICAV